MRSRFASQNLNCTYQVTCVGFSSSSDLLFTGGLDNDIKVIKMFILFCGAITHIHCTLS